MTMQFDVVPAAARRRVWLGALSLGLLLIVPLAPAPVHAQVLPDFADLAERVGPAVVNIRTTERTRSARGGGAGPEIDEDMLEFFRRFGLPIPSQPSPRGQQRPAPDNEPQQRGVGSGFIFTADGFVMTNAHVVEGADEVFVTLTDKREFKARIIGSDRRSDVALVKIEASALPTVRIGDVGKLRVGEWVVAIGSPFGLENTVTAGIVSALDRTITSPNNHPIGGAIQTDAAINSGNSGGPLLNLSGQVIGVNSQIESSSGGNIGIGFAVPSNTVKKVVAQLIADGKATHPYLGVKLGDSSDPAGAKVGEVASGAPADKAGLQNGDVITAVDGTAVTSSDQLIAVLAADSPGDQVQLTVSRGGSTQTVTVTLGSRA